MSEFKVGDKVRVINGRWYDENEVGAVTKLLLPGYDIEVTFADDEYVVVNPANVAPVMTEQPANDASATPSLTDAIQERYEQWMQGWDYLYQSCQPMVQDIGALLDANASLRAQLAAATGALKPFALTQALSVFVTIVPEWQGNYAYDWNEVLVIVGSEWRDGVLFYEVLGRAGKGYVDAAQLRLAAAILPTDDADDAAAGSEG